MGVGFRCLGFKGSGVEGLRRTRAAKKVGTPLYCLSRGKTSRKHMFCSLRIKAYGGSGRGFFGLCVDTV